MKSIRLSEVTRDQIISQMMDGYKEITPAPISKSDAANKAGIALWGVVYGRIKFSAIPQDFLVQSYRISAQFGGDFVQFIMKSKMPATSTSYSPNPCKVFNKTPGFYKKYLAEVAAYEKWDAACDSFRSELRSILYSVNTTKQLIDIWPECVKYLPQGSVDSIQTCNLPALKTAELNKKLGIKAA